jgi:predicted nucleotide-binding protein
LPLQIEDWELTRTHWAVKSADLLDVLENAAALVASVRARQGQYLFARRTVLKACDILSTLGHTVLDRLLLDIGVDGLQAGRAEGTRAQRTNRLAEYVLRHPEERTAEGEQLALAIVRAAARADPTYPAERNEMDLATRHEFWNALKRDGYRCADGGIVPDVAEAEAAPPYAAPRSRPAESSSAAEASGVPKRRPSMSHERPQVFIVHGRDDAAKHEVARFLQQLDLEPVILHERPNRGRTLITKFQEESADIHFAVVLMTPDDVGGLAGAASFNARARQNVIFELGFFIGKLGASRVCALVVGEIERPSDFDAVVYVTFGSGTTWKTELARELRHAGVAFDANKVF